MNYNKSINEYFDGNLDSTNQEVLFNELSKNEELRYDFNQLFAIKLAIGNDTKAFVPAVSTSDKLFANLGIAASAKQTSRAGFWALYKAPILSGFIATVATALFMLWLLPINDTDHHQSTGVAIVTSYESDKASLEIELPNETNGKVNSYSDIENRNLPEQIGRIRNDNLKLRHNVSNLGQQLESMNLMLNQLKDENYALRKSSDRLKESNNEEAEYIYPVNTKSVFQSNFITTPNVLNTNDNISYIINVVDVYNPETSIKLEAALGRYYQNLGTDFIERNNTFSDNIRLSGLYNLSRDYSLGLDLRQENFYQEFTDINNDGKKIEYQQQPTVYTASMLFRYSPEYLEFLKVRPNVDLSVGVSNIGELARVGFGLDYYLFSNTYMYFKSDYTFLSFHHKDVNFSTNKIGTHLGMGVEF